MLAVITDWSSKKNETITIITHNKRFKPIIKRLSVHLKHIKETIKREIERLENRINMIIGNTIFSSV